LWCERLVGQAPSGLTVRAFCHREALCESAFYYWRREIRRRDGLLKSNRQATGAVSFLQLHAAPMPAGVDAAQGQAPLELLLPGQRRLLIRCGCEAALLTMVLAGLEGESC
jgi:hypothetical protein